MTIEHGRICKRIIGTAEVFQDIRDDKVKSQHFLSGLPQSYKDRIEFDEPRTLEEEIRKAKYCYDQNKSKPGIHKAWKGKRNEKFDQRKKGFKPSNFQNQQRRLPQAVTKLSRVMEDKPRDPKEPREPLQCWGCGGYHMLRNCLHQNGNVSQVHNIQKVETLVQVVRTIPRIYATLEDCQEDHQSTMVEVEGNIAN